MNICPASKEDLDAINQVIEAAIMRWNLPGRVKRLSLPSYRYTETDLAHYEMKVAEKNGRIIGISAWEEIDDTDIMDGKTGLLLHGIYVHPEYQHQGIGKLLFHAAEVAVKKKNLKGLLVKAQKDSINFFIKMRMQEVQINNANKDYANRLWKDI